MREATIAVMREVGIDISHQRPKSLEAATGPDVRLVVGLCAIPGVRSLHWPLPDPAGFPIAEYRKVRDELSRRIRRLISDLPEEA